MVSGIGHLHWLPVFLALLALIAFFTAYGMAVKEGYLNALFPYISDAGGRPPQSCIFGQFLNIAAVIGSLSIYIHYKHIKEFNITDMPLIIRLNVVSLWMGCLACLGMSIVANFQVYNSLVTHMIGAFMVFGLGMVYCWMQCVISYKMRHMGMSSSLSCHTRFILSMAVTLFFITTFVAASVATEELTKSKDSTRGNSTTTAVTPTSSMYEHRWKKSDPGYDAHLTSTFSEWFMAICFLLYFLTYFREFQKIQMRIKIEPKNAEIFSSSGNMDVSDNKMFV